jgi:Rps23 Pro-64 3,4-dihydroxylase Tpa1-like proline 4-hydroxylase
MLSDRPHAAAAFGKNVGCLMMFNFDEATKYAVPFPHLRIADILRRNDADRVLRWLREEAPWKLTVADFYEQYEFSLLDLVLPSGTSRLIESNLTEKIGASLESFFGVGGGLELVEVTAHKLVPGQTIRTHNDFLGDEETHRLLVQLNSGWEAGQGGLLMLFGSEAPESLHSVLLPTHGSGFAFEISPNSFHAVSSIRDGERYTLVYTFRRRA